MKRIASSVGFLFVAAVAALAAVWDGSAVAGTAGDFPNDGYYGACNSFPRDTSVAVTNLENGKSVTVTITRSVDNPGVFIALSPKAAADLGMRAGAATRIRAVAQVASQADSSLPPARAGGESSDPDYNPKVYVEREKAAAAVAPSPAPVAASSSPPAAQAKAAGAPEPEGAEVLAKVGEPQKESSGALPALSEPATSAAASKGTAPAAAAPLVVAAPIVAPGDDIDADKPRTKVFTSTGVKPEASQASRISPKPVPVVADLPAPNPPRSVGVAPSKPEAVGGDAKPSPRKPGTPRVVFFDPPLQGPLNDKTAMKIPGKASVDELRRPTPLKGSVGLALADPRPEFAPDLLPDAVLSRVTAPATIAPMPMLAEARPPKGLGGSKNAPEAIAMARPSYAQSVETALLEASALAPSEAFALSAPKKAHGVEYVWDEGLSELQAPDAPAPAEGLAAAPQAEQGSEPGPLSEPVAPSPTESLSAAHPSTASGGDTMVTLEPATPRPPAAAAQPAAPQPAAATPGPAKPQPATVAAVASPPPVGTVQPPASVPVIKGLAKGSYYVQIGVYGTGDALQSAVSDFKSSHYPLAVEKLTTKKGAPAFRLFVGPLSRDESGLVLMRIRSLGFKDAYVRQGT